MTNVIDLKQLSSIRTLSLPFFILNILFRFCRAVLSTHSFFRIFADSAHKLQTTVTLNQILTQKWFLLQNLKNSS
jgi:hypothetical protein